MKLWKLHYYLEDSFRKNLISANKLSTDNCSGQQNILKWLNIQYFWIFLKKRWRKFYIKVECHVELFAFTHVIIKRGHHQHFNHLKKSKSTHFFLYSEFDTFFKATFKVLMVIWYDNQYFENGRSTLFTKGNCQHQNKQKNLFSRMRCSVLCSLWQFVYRSSRKYHFSSP